MTIIADLKIEDLNFIRNFMNTVYRYHESITKEAVKINKQNFITIKEMISLVENTNNRCMITGKKLSSMSFILINDRTKDITIDNVVIVCRDVSTVYINKKNNAFERNIPFTLTVSELYKLKSEKYCYYSGKEMNNIPHDDYQRTIERIDSSKGYSKENTVAICNKLNNIKNSLIDEGLFTDRQLMQMFTKLTIKNKILSQQ